MRALFVFVALAGLSTGAGAQQTALTAIAPVVDQCRIVADNQERGDTSTDGLCVGKTQSFLTTLAASKPSSAVLDQTVADLVVQLATLASEDKTCNKFDTEIAAAIKLASTYSTDPDQQAQLIEISQTVGSCTNFSTAALGIEGIEASRT